MELQTSIHHSKDSRDSKVTLRESSKKLSWSNTYIVTCWEREREREHSNILRANILYDYFVTVNCTISNALMVTGMKTGYGNACRVMKSSAVTNQPFAFKKRWVNWLLCRSLLRRTRFHFLSTWTIKAQLDTLYHHNEWCTSIGYRI